MHSTNASRVRSGGRRGPRTPVVVPACRCAGACRCGGLVPRLLIRQLERECEFYRSVM